MAERFRFRAYPTSAGIVLLLIPVLFFFQKMRNFGTSEIVVGVGLSALCQLSLLFLLFSIPRIHRSLQSFSLRGIPPLPNSMLSGESLIVKAKPSLPSFRPGVRVSVRWKLRFGPRKCSVLIPLPAQGTGQGVLTIGHRGAWEGSSFLRITDSFGLFVFEYILPVLSHVTVPPREVKKIAYASEGWTKSEEKNTPRPSSDTEDRQERRVYIPGDDPRQMDWKHFARTGELLVRIGEERLPARDKIWLEVIAPPGWFKKESLRQLDGCLETSDALIRSLQSGGHEVSALLPGEKQWMDVGKNWKQRLATALPSQPTGKETIPPPNSLVWVVTSPNNQMGAERARLIQTHKCQTSLLWTPFLQPGLIGQVYQLLSRWKFGAKSHDSNQIEPLRL